MSKISIKAETFVQDGVTSYGEVCGTVEVEFGKVVTARAVKYADGTVAVAGFIGRYQTSNNPWVAHVRTEKDSDRIFATFGRDDRSGRFHKLRGISWEPALYETIGNMPYWHPVAS